MVYKAHELTELFEEVSSVNGPRYHSPLLICISASPGFLAQTLRLQSVNPYTSHVETDRSCDLRSLVTMYLPTSKFCPDLANIGKDLFAGPRTRGPKLGEKPHPPTFQTR